MLSLRCRRFRAGFTPGLDDPHRRSCAACAAFAAAMERAARREPLPARLRSKLRAVPGTAGGGPRLPLPQAPLPDALRGRLQGIARARPPQPLPVWVRSSRYALAASYVLALLVGSAFGSLARPLQAGRAAADLVVRTVDGAVRPRLERAVEQADGVQSALRTGYVETRKTLEGSLGNLEDRVDSLRQSLISLQPATDFGLGRASEALEGERHDPR